MSDTPRQPQRKDPPRAIPSTYDPAVDDPSLHDKSDHGLRYRTLSKSKSSVFLPRLVQRDLTYHQSKNNISVKNDNGRNMIWPLLMRDWFHVLLRLPFFVSIFGLLTIWTCAILVFAGLYVMVDTKNKDTDCGLGLNGPGFPITWAAAFAFSLETCTTVGYTLPGSVSAFFETDCPSVQITIFFQMMWSMMFNAFLFAFFYTSLSKCESRGTQVVFSNKIIIKEQKGTGKIVICARCYDVDARYPVVEAHVRMYLMDRRLKLHRLRILEPDDDLGAMLHISVPTEIVHHVDHHSALAPRGMPFIVDGGGLVNRSADSAAANREEIECPVCAEAYGTYERLWNHVKFNQIAEKASGYPVEGTHQAFVIPDIIPISLQEVKTHVESFMSEIIVVVEGIDPQVSGTFQALQSYKYEDIAWEGEFEPCLMVKHSEFSVDLAKFHQVRMPLDPPSDGRTDPENGSSVRKVTIQELSGESSRHDNEEGSAPPGIVMSTPRSYSLSD